MGEEAGTEIRRQFGPGVSEPCSLPLIQSESKADVVLIVFQSNGQEKTKYVKHVVVVKGKTTTHVQQTAVAGAGDSICKRS